MKIYFVSSLILMMTWIGCTGVLAIAFTVILLVLFTFLQISRLKKLIKELVNE